MTSTPPPPGSSGAPPPGSPGAPPGRFPLPQPGTAAGRAGLAALLSDPGRALLGFDFDGTLAPIVPDPTAARAHPGAVDALARLAPYVGRMVVITGRPAQTAADYGGFAAVPGLDRLTILGQYGRERWEATTGQVVTPPPPPGVERARRELPALLARVGAPAGTSIEDKGAALAVHTRRSADPEGGFDLLHRPLAELAAGAGLALEPGRLVLELRAAGVDKGAALLGVVGEAGPAGVSAVVFAGDDLGDLAAYDAVDRLRADGIPGLLLCSGSPEVTAVAARADLVVDGPAGVVDFLDALTAALAAGKG